MMVIREGWPITHQFYRCLFFVHDEKIKWFNLRVDIFWAFQIINIADSGNKGTIDISQKHKKSKLLQIHYEIHDLNILEFGEDSS